jgi:hypothetical protein
MIQNRIEMLTTIREIQALAQRHEREGYDLTNVEWYRSRQPDFVKLLDKYHRLRYGTPAPVDDVSWVENEATEITTSLRWRQLQDKKKTETKRKSWK